MTTLQTQGKSAKAAAYTLSTAGTAKKNQALEAIARILTERQAEWLSANAEDVAAAREAGMRPAMLDRLTLTPLRIAGIVDGIRQVIALPDPIGKADKTETRPNGLIISRRRVPLGVIAIIFEARPNVTVDAAALCLKSGNACILRGGKEAIRSNRCVTALMREALSSVGLPEDCISLVQDTSRETAKELMHLNGYVDVLIPRGGAELIRTVAKEASVPVIRTGEGVCHIYIDSEADLDMGAEILCNAKCSRPSVCNAAETVLVHEAVAKEFLPRLKERLDRHGVELRGCPRTREILGDCVKPASEEDYAAEFLDYILALRVVESREEAMAHIARYSTGHSECIVTEDYTAGEEFLQEVDAAVVYVNASTRFTDGGEFGLGTELGISTQKLHARGPMGLGALTSYKYLVRGNGQIR